MAGIGFRFREMVYEGTYSSEIKGYVYASLFAAGPWIMTMMIIFALTLIAPPEVSGHDLLVFRASITYIYAYSLIFIGIFYLPLTRFLADKLFEENLSNFFTAYLGSLVVAGIASILPCSIFLHFNTGPLVFKMFVMLIFITVSMTWMGMVFLSALREYNFIILTFFIGSAASVAVSLLFKEYWGLNGYLAGYLIGQMVIFTGVSAQIFSSFKYERPLTLNFLGYLKKYPLLIVSGVAYNLGIWMDKFVIWNSPVRESYYGNLNIFSHYDTAVFIAYLTVIPALGYFYVRVETSFYELYRQYFANIFMKRPLKNLLQLQKSIIYTVDVSLLNLIKNQGVILLLCLYFSELLVSFVGGEALTLSIIRYALVAIFFQILFLFCTIFMMYFEFYVPLAFTNVLFMILNGGLTHYVIYYTDKNMALGFTIAAASAFLTAYYLLRKNLQELVYYTFIKQPVINEIPRNQTMDIFKTMDEFGMVWHKDVYKMIEFGKDESRSDNHG